MTTSLNDDAINSITELAQQAAIVQEITIGDRKFTDRKIVPVDLDPEGPEAEDFSTLDGLVAFLLAEPQAKGALVHVVSPTFVRAISPLCGVDKNKRRVFASAECTSTGALGFVFNNFGPLEGLAIALQTCFAPKLGDVEALRKFCASVRSSASVGLDDDSVSQTVEAKRGIAAVQVTGVKNPWDLAPWRTFTEVAQPLSPFVLRFRESESAPSAGLFETGDRSWQVAAVGAIAFYLKGQLEGAGFKVLG